MTSRLPVLDGLRALSILLVLGGHLLPLGPKAWQLNATATVGGMALFFALSGFLIVRFLATGMVLWDFALRRLARIIPLAWTAMLVLWLASGGNLTANILFYANLPPARLLHGGEHLWSLCVEVQFYAAAALLCLSPGRFALRLVPVLAVAVTAFRIASGEPVSIVTWHRVDEILAGGSVALIYCGWFGARPAAILTRIPLWLSIALLTLCSHPAGGILLYLRPYAGGLVLASALYGCDRLSERILTNPVAAYIAEISYALYVVHGMLMVTWLASGTSSLTRYLKRPLLLATSFGLAHLSTVWFERPITRLVRKYASTARPPRVLMHDPPPPRT